MARNKISDLRNHLFETLEALRDKDKPLEIERARSIANVAQAIINSAKVEIDMVNAVGGFRDGTRPAATFFEIREAHEPSNERPRLGAPRVNGGSE